MSQQDSVDTARRGALKCLAFGGAGTLFALSGGVFTPIDLAVAAETQRKQAPAGALSFVQLSDTHIGFNKAANPDVAGTLRQTIALVNALPQPPALIIHTGDITHLSRADEFDIASQLLSGLRTSELHTVPGEHDLADASVSEYFNRFGKPSGRKGYYSFDHAGVHFIALINVLNFKPGGLGALGSEQLAWLESDLKARSASTPIVVFAHMPLWSIYEPWGWGTADAQQALGLLRRFGSVTVLNGHIHQIVQKVEGQITFHTARSTAYPQPAPGAADAPGPLQVPSEQLPRMLGLTSVSVTRHPTTASLNDATLASAPTAASVSIKGMQFQPSSLTVPVGASVTWNNLDGEPHTVASATGVFRSGALDQNDSFTQKFDKSGVYPYICAIHPQMAGTVIVE